MSHFQAIILGHQKCSVFTKTGMLHNLGPNILCLFFLVLFLFFFNVIFYLLQVNIEFSTGWV